jgi:hypothetical protein
MHHGKSGCLLQNARGRRSQHRNYLNSCNVLDEVRSTSTGNTTYLHWESARFESWPGHQPSWLRFSVGFPQYIQTNAAKMPPAGHKHFLQNPYQNTCRQISNACKFSFWRCIFTSANLFWKVQHFRFQFQINLRSKYLLSLIYVNMCIYTH